MASGSRFTARRRARRRVVLASLRGQLLFLATITLVTIGMGGALLLNDMAQRAAQDSCDEWSLVDLTMAEVIAIKQRKRSYQRDPSPDAHMSLYGDEITFLMRDLLDFQVWVHLEHDLFRMHLTWPSNEYCYNIDATGRLDGEDGVVVVVLDELVIGDLVLTPVVAERAWAVTPSLLERAGQQGVANQLRKTTRMWIDRNQVHFTLEDKWDFF